MGFLLSGWRHGKGGREGGGGRKGEEGDGVGVGGEKDAEGTIMAAFFSAIDTREKRSDRFPIFNYRTKIMQTRLKREHNKHVGRERNSHRENVFFPAPSPVAPPLVI